ncbi:MAG: DNA polymerase II, partial [Candidatus Thermoplasmatota archaeon]|nr:DNA polymerase II [Candidatus Thermoplasmatota archaeon]
MRCRILVISGNYKTDDEGVTIELFGRTSDSRSATLLIKGFHPYFHIVEPGDDVKEKLSKDPMVRSLDERTLWYKGKDRRCTKVTIKYPFKVP